MEKKVPKPMAKWDRSKGRPEPIRALNKILELENNEPLVAISDLAPTVRILRPQVIPYLRETVVRMLDGAARALPSGIYLGVIDAWRPFARQQRIYDFMPAKLFRTDRMLPFGVPFVGGLPQPISPHLRVTAQGLRSTFGW